MCESVFYRINPIYVDDEHNNDGTWNKSGSSGYDSQPHSDHSSLDKNSSPTTKCLRNNTTPPPPPSPSDRSTGSLQYKTTLPWLSPIKEGVIDVHQYCIPRPVWPGRDDVPRYPDPERIPRVKCCRHCARCRCRGSDGNGSSSSGSNGNGSSSSGSNGGGNTTAGGSYSGYSSAYGGSGGGTISTNSTGGGGDGGVDGTCSCSDDATPSSLTASVKSDPQSPALTLEPRFSDGVNNKTLVTNWNSIDLRLNQKTDNLQYVSQTPNIYIYPLRTEYFTKTESSH